MSNCTCGHPKEYHDSPGQRINGGCEGLTTAGGHCFCPLYREVVSWPTSEGAWYFKYNFGEEIVFASDFGDPQLSLLRFGFVCRESPESIERFGPARFVKQTEQSPFETFPAPT